MASIVPRAARVGIICGSARVLRAGPQVASFVRRVIEADVAAHPPTPALALSFEDLDVAALGLPATFEEPGIPSMVAAPDGYTLESTRAWSRRVAALDAFVFVTPQYNCGLPSTLKNAIDYLFSEWVGKPFMVVSYGGQGGIEAANALQLILGQGVKMRALDETVSLSFPSREVVMRAFRGEDLGTETPLPAADGDAAAADAAATTTWQDKKPDILRVWQKLVALLSTPTESSS